MYKNDTESVEIVTVALSQNNASLIYLEENHLNMKKRSSPPNETTAHMRTNIFRALGVLFFRAVSMPNN